MDGIGMISDPNGGMRAGFGNANSAADFDHVLMNSLFAPRMSPSLHDTQNMLDFNKVCASTTPKPNFPTVEQLGLGIDQAECESDDSTASAGEKPHHGCRKRLSVHQLHCLEKCFKNDSKLEPRRKTELARELGLKPRQVAIWFQNRRARQKNKQIENDYDKVAGQYGMIKTLYDKAINENMRLKAQMKCIKEEMSRMKDSLINYGKLMQAGLLDARMKQTQSQAKQAQEEPQLMEQTQPELHQANKEINTARNGGITVQQVQVQQQVISPANSVFDSNSPVVKPMSKPSASMDISLPLAEPDEKRSTNFTQVEQENSVNQEPPYDLPDLFDLDEQNCFYSSQVDGPPISTYDFGIIPASDDPFWQFEI